MKKKTYRNLIKQGKTYSPVLKKPLAKKIVSGIFKGAAGLLIVAYATLETLNHISKSGIDTRPFKDPIGNISDTIKDPDNNTDLPIQVPPVFTQDDLDNAEFSFPFIMNNIFEDVNHHENILSLNAKIAGFQFNDLDNKLEFLIADNNNTYLVRYSAINNIDLNENYVFASDAIGQLSYYLDYELAYSETIKLTEFPSNVNSAIVNYATKYNNINNLRLIGYTNTYLSTNLTHSETETIDVYGFGFVNGTYTKFITSFGRLNSNYYETTILEDINSYLVEYNQIPNITTEQNEALLNKYSLFTDVQENCMEYQNKMETTVLYVQEYIEQNLL